MVEHWTQTVEESHDHHVSGNPRAGGDRSDADSWTFELPSLILILKLERGILNTAIIDRNLSISRKVLDPLRTETRRIINAANHGTVPKNTDAFVIVVLEVLDYVVEWELEHQLKAESASEQQKWRADGVFDNDMYLTNDLGLDASTVPDTALSFLGKTPEQICEQLPTEFRVIHIESIYRSDLANRFAAYRQVLKERLESISESRLRRCMPPHSATAKLSTLRKGDAILDMCKPRVTFHGTPLRNVASIVRYGFKMPGSLLTGGALVASPRSGVVFDRGIYSSPSSAYALSYATPDRRPTPVGELPSIRLFVCATMMGRTLSDHRLLSPNPIHGPLVEGYDSHFDGGLEYIVHNEAAILPCYVIHLDFGTEVAKAAIRQVQEDPWALEKSARENVHPALNRENLSPGDRKREAERKKAAAMKWFPAGFGTAKGTSFVIEEIGEIEDDEEEYGEWQQDRHGFDRKDASIWEDHSEYYEDFDEDGKKIMVKRGLALDEYQSARRVHNK